MSDIVERLMDEDVENRHGASAVLLGQLLGEAADEIERLRAERGALAKVRPLTSGECQKLHEADTWCDLDSAFMAIMAARGIEVGE